MIVQLCQQTIAKKKCGRLARFWAVKRWRGYNDVEQSRTIAVCDRCVEGLEVREAIDEPQEEAPKHEHTPSERSHTQSDYYAYCDCGAVKRKPSEPWHTCRLCVGEDAS